MGGKSGECLRENWESWILRRCSAKIGGALGFRGGKAPGPLGYGPAPPPNTLVKNQEVNCAKF